MGRKKIVVASGYFNPLHFGHIEYLEKSKELGDILVVIVNNDKQTLLKKGKVLISATDRIKVIRALECVDLVIESVDEDRTVCKTLAALHPDIFTNGGDQSNENIPEAEVCNRLNIKMVDSLGSKVESSSDIVRRAKEMP
jgi:rfaE bifunctional protein nucleotidyltransferase chain/domain